eukprot:Phypoly_transcript_03465.p1 GENE.Phypoly_transcript_03465~~Phypoly_transcript_03465.p1  ORF type:complete len:338 (-),score=55.26 Phypoly_transcript_03465:176-1189(-)
MEKYEKKHTIGQGTFGVVSLAIEKATGKKVALKKIRLLSAKDGVNFTALREIKVLQEIKHENVIGLIESFSHKSNIHLAFDFMDYDLEAIIKDRNIILAEADIKSYMLQVLRGVEVLHKNWILHRDLKPNNLLLDNTGCLKIADFGFARTFGSPNNQMTHEVVTRWYRAPELLYGAKSYSDAIDMWAVGCIFAELMLRNPYFPGSSDIEQLSCIFSALGTPDEQIWPGVSSLPDYVPYNYCPPTPFRQLFSAASDDALDLLAEMLRYDPNKRISASDALKHPYFSSYPTATAPAKLPRPVTRKSDDITPSKRTNPDEENGDERPTSRRKFSDSETRF